MDLSTLFDKLRPDLHRTEGVAKPRSTRSTVGAAGTPPAAELSPLATTVKRGRHIHEFMALGETKSSLEDCKRLSWVDLSASRSPVLFINHTNETSQNAKFMASSTGNNLSYLVATKDIPPYTEILTSYMEHLDVADPGVTESERIPKKQRKNIPSS